MPPRIAVFSDNGASPSSLIKLLEPAVSIAEGTSHAFETR
jgi:hypothetical protein